MEFLKFRNLEHLSEVFFSAKLDDSVVAKLTTCKLLELGLVYGDIIAFKVAFPEEVLEENKEKTYSERAKDLKEKLSMVHSKKNDTKNRPVHVKSVFEVNFSLKCKEKDKYVLKIKNNCTLNVPVTMSYDQFHEMARNKFRIHTSKTFIGSYNMQPWEEKISTFQDFLNIQKEKKKQPNMYLFYPLSYTRYLFEKEGFPTDDEDDLSQSGIVPLLSTCENCFELYLTCCYNCELRKEQEQVSNLDGDFINEAWGVSSSNVSMVCIQCGCTKESDSCLRCEQNKEYDSSLIIDRAKNSALLEAEEEEVSLNSITREEMRSVRMERFSRPIRYRHSIGSPSLSLATSSSSPPHSLSASFSLATTDSTEDTTLIKRSKKSSTETDEYNAFGDDEILRFFEDEISSVNEEIQVDNEEHSVPGFDILDKAVLEASSLTKRDKHIIAQRDPHLFWSVIFRQRLNLKASNIIVRFAGEAAADTGGPLREFLTLAMAGFSEAGIMFFWQEGYDLFLCQHRMLLNW